MRFAYDEEGKGKNPFWIEKLTPTKIHRVGLRWLALIGIRHDQEHEVVFVRRE